MRPSINTPPGGRSGSVVRKLLPRKRNQRVVDDQDRQGQGDDSQGFDLPGYLLDPVRVWILWILLFMIFLLSVCFEPR